MVERIKICQLFSPCTGTWGAYQKLKRHENGTRNRVNQIAYTVRIPIPGFLMQYFYKKVNDKN